MSADSNRKLFLLIPVRSGPTKPYMILKEHDEEKLNMAKPIELLRW